jgi:hypothetical protein
LISDVALGGLCGPLTAVTLHQHTTHAPHAPEQEAAAGGFKHAGHVGLQHSGAAQKDLRLSSISSVLRCLEVTVAGLCFANCNAHLLRLPGLLPLLIAIRVALLVFAVLLHRSRLQCVACRSQGVRL